MWKTKNKIYTLWSGSFLVLYIYFPNNNSLPLSPLCLSIVKVVLYILYISNRCFLQKGSRSLPNTSGDWQEGELMGRPGACWERGGEMGRLGPPPHLQYPSPTFPHQTLHDANMMDWSSPDVRLLLPYYWVISSFTQFSETVFWSNITFYGHLFVQIKLQLRWL